MKEYRMLLIAFTLALMMCFGAMYPRYVFQEGIVKTEEPIESVLTASANQIRIRLSLWDLNN